MLQEFSSSNLSDVNDLPAGGMVDGLGFHIEWQRGPLKEGPSSDPNGASVETVIAAALQRIEWYQTVVDGKFSCEENANAIDYLRGALDVLAQRTRDRVARGVEGTHQQ